MTLVRPCVGDREQPVDLGQQVRAGHDDAGEAVQRVPGVRHEGVQAGEVEPVPVVLEGRGREAEQPLELGSPQIQVEAEAAGRSSWDASSKPGTSWSTMVANGWRRSGPT